MLRARSFTLDGEAVVVGHDGVAVFDALHRRHKANDAILYAFDLLELNGKDLRPTPLSGRRTKLDRLLARASTGIVFSEHTDEDGAVVFRHACKLGLEGIVSKRLSAPYRSGPSRDWVKVKNPDSPAIRRAPAGRWLGRSGLGLLCRPRHCRSGQAAGCRCPPRRTEAQAVIGRWNEQLGTAARATAERTDSG
jgi:bifunctional non-homologous end joining protein LigD